MEVRDGFSLRGKREDKGVARVVVGDGHEVARAIMSRRGDWSTEVGVQEFTRSSRSGLGCLGAGTLTSFTSEAPIAVGESC